MTDERNLEQWGGELANHCAAKLAKCISATDLVMNRSGFGQVIRPAPGSVLASPAVAFDSGEPDYFFHWVRDSAAVMDAVCILAKADEPSADWAKLFNEFVQFSLDLRKIDGQRVLDESDFRAKTSPEFQQYLRPDEEIAAVHGNLVAGDVRYNADGTLDFILWHRPQHDGPAFRALVAMRFEDDVRIFGEAKGRLAELIHFDLSYTAKTAGQSCYDIWEEEFALHYSTLLVQLAALEKGAARAKRDGRMADAGFFSAKARDLHKTLDAFWEPSLGFYRSRIIGPGVESPKALDFAVILGVLHASLDKGPHSVQDERVMLTFRKLQELFAAEYAINRGEHGIMFGRYKGDNYVSGGAYYFSTFGAAEYYYRLAQTDPGHHDGLIEKGDAILSRIRNFIPASGHLSEQFDRTAGGQTSAKDLSWSYACFIAAWHARRTALGQRGLV